MYCFLVGCFYSIPFSSTPLGLANRWSLGSSPAAYPSLSSNALDDLQSDLTILLESVLSHSSLRPNNLVIVPGKKAWTAKLDAVVFANGGNVVDCLMLACRAALWDTKVPRTKGVEYRAPHGHATQGDGFEREGLSRATDFELTDYWDEGEVLSGRESWPVCVTVNVVRPSFRLVAHALIRVLLVIGRALPGRHAARRSIRTITDVCDVRVSERETCPPDFPISWSRSVYLCPNKRSHQGWYQSSLRFPPSESLSRHDVAARRNVRPECMGGVGGETQ